VLASLLNGENINRDTLRKVAREVKVSQGKSKDDLVHNLREFARKELSVAPKVTVANKRGPGRPKADPTKIVGYKVKIGLRYPKADGSLTTNMREGETFTSIADGQKIVDQLVKAGEIRVWGGAVRAKFLPRYGKSE
jgi:hypothetical protein